MDLLLLHTSCEPYIVDYNEIKLLRPVFPLHQFRSITYDTITGLF